MIEAYEKAYRESLSDPESFWGKAAESCFWFRKWDRILDDSRKPFTRWFPGGLTNSCYNALDFHVENGHGDRPALIYDSPVTGVIRSFTYSELKDQAALFAGALSALGVAKGDRVILYMPMIPQAVVAMLACARIGAVHSVVFGGFAPRELATRINDAKPKVIVSASCGVEGKKVLPYKPLLDEAIRLSSHAPEKCIVFQRPMAQAELLPGRDLSWDQAVLNAEPADCVPVAATDPLYILYTSGTTGQPKGVVRDNGGHMVALKWSMKAIYGVGEGEVWWAASDVGWVVGHSYIVYAPLFAGCTTVLFEGKPVGTPDAGVFWRVIAQHKVATMFTAPTAYRAIKREDPDALLMKGRDLSHFRALFLAGERSDPDTILWSEKNLKVPVIDHWWQTETGWPIVANCLGLHRFPVKYGSPTKAVPGWDVRALDDRGQELAPGETGTLAVRLPLPPGSLATLWNNDQGYVDTYLTVFPGYYNTSDAGFVDSDGYIYVMSRTDDIINVAGHRLSTGAMEEILSDHPDVAECAVLGVSDKLKGQLPLGLLVLKAGVRKSREEVVAEVVKMVRERIGPVAAFKVAGVVERLPKTRSGKVLRGVMRKIADHQDYKVPATIDDPAILSEIERALTELGYACALKPE